ncbi:hypothetical protein [uncultured Psychroserpens sp.]|uniref:hypothetical protein n=1 Tax=uncultured Psychroserpens sp. TaxID=255436 RepID=UPI002604C1BB|nr:hypothetical protein [uncultured Psychroserpens sp.]
MNSKKELLNRVLRLYPYNNVKSHFGEKAKNRAELIDDILSQTPEEDIYDYCYSNFGFTRKHVHIFEKISSKIDLSTSFDVLYSKVESTSLGTENFYIIKSNHNIKVIQPYQELDFSFPWPIKITQLKDETIFEFTILERNVAPYLPEGLELLQSQRTLDELEFLDICKTKNKLHFSPVDLHKGIKHMWDKDIIDALQADWKKPKSSSKVTMDESYTLKKAYPKLYEQIMKSEITKTNFCFLNDGDFSKRFRIEPKDGTIAFPLYPKTNDSNINVILDILKYNK